MKYIRKLVGKFRLRREIARLAGPKVLAELSAVHPNLTFVQVGANNGKMMDPIRSTVLENDWHGWALEPVPELYEQLKYNYKLATPRVSAVNLALSEADGEKEFFHLRSMDGMDPLPEWASGLGSFDLDVILKHEDRLPNIKSYIQKLYVSCLTWDSFCKSLHISGVDLLVVDVEGYDYNVIRQLDFIVHRPFLIVYEHHHFDRETERACTALLAAHGYRMFTEGLDTWAIDVGRSDPRYHRLIARISQWVTGSPYASLK